MAIEHLASVTPHPVASDLTSLQACSDLLKQSGHPASVTTLRRWIEEHRIDTVRRGRADYVSFSDILEVHRDEVAKRDGPYGS